jgi:hypothetical protein
MATRVALPLLYLCSLVLGVADAESGVASSSRALGSNASPASLPSTRGTRTPQSAGGRVTFAASASQEEPEWEYEVQSRLCHSHMIFSSLPDSFIPVLLIASPRFLLAS